MSEPVSTEEGSSAHQSQDDAIATAEELHFVDEEEEDSSPVSQTESIDQEQSSSRRRSPSRWSPWEAGRRAMKTSSTICRGAGTRSAGQCEGQVHLRTLSKIRR